MAAIGAVRRDAAAATRLAAACAALVLLVCTSVQAKVGTGCLRRCSAGVPGPLVGPRAARVIGRPAQGCDAACQEARAAMSPGAMPEPQSLHATLLRLNAKGKRWHQAPQAARLIR
jgi:hypothetical protein